MRLEQTIQVEGGSNVVIREMTPSNWNIICKELGEELDTMTIAKAISMGPDKLATLAGDMVEFDGNYSDIGYASLIQIWVAWKGVSESFLALLEMTKPQKTSDQTKEPAANLEE